MGHVRGEEPKGRSCLAMLPWWVGAQKKSPSLEGDKEMEIEKLGCPGESEGGQQLGSGADWGGWMGGMWGWEWPVRQWNGLCKQRVPATLSSVSLRSCLASQDPYCGWHRLRGCVSIREPGG